MGTLIFALTVSLVSQAYSYRSIVDLAKVKAVLAKKNVCYLALTSKIKASPGQVVDPVFCVLEGTIGSGTSNAVSGCTVAQYKTTTGEIITLMSPSKILVPESFKGTKCTKETVEKMLDSTAYNFLAPAGMVKVSEKPTIREHLKSLSDTVLQDDFGVWK